jgi:hypothetical protein
MTKRTKGFPYDHIVNEETKTIEITWRGNGYVGRLGVPRLVEQHYPGYNYIFVKE